MKKISKILWPLLLMIASIFACGKTSGTSPLASLETPKIPVLFLAGQKPDQRSGFTFTLFDPATNSVTSRTIDLSSVNPEMINSSMAFSTGYGTQFIHNNPKTREIFIVLPPPLPGPGDPVPLDINFMIYKTSFDPNSGVASLLYSSKLEDTFVTHVTVNVESNTLLMDFSKAQETIHEIWSFDFGSGQMKQIAATQGIYLDKQLIETSDLRVSQDGKRLDQLLLYGNPQYTTDQTLSLMTVDLRNDAVNYKEITTGTGLQFYITALSEDDTILAYYTALSGDNSWQLWTKNLDNGTASPITLPETIGNIRLHLSGDGKKLLIGLASGWNIYDLEARNFLPIAMEYPLAWDSTGRYLAGTNQESFSYYDFQSQTWVNLPALGFGPNDFLYAAQWR